VRTSWHGSFPAYSYDCTGPVFGEIGTCIYTAQRRDYRIWMFAYKRMYDCLERIYAARFVP
jgi:hypothetical protein